MIELKDLLQRFEGVLLLGEAKKDSIRSVISEAIKTEIKRENIKIKNGTVYLDLKPIYKNEILLKKDVISAKLEEIFGSRAPKNLR